MYHTNPLVLLWFHCNESSEKIHYMYISLYRTCEIQCMCKVQYDLHWAHADSNGPDLQIPQFICPESHNAPLWNRNVHISVPNRCIVGYGTGELWDFLDWSIKPTCKWSHWWSVCNGCHGALWEIIDLHNWSAEINHGWLMAKSICNGCIYVLLNTLIKKLWLPFRKLHFLKHFLEWKSFILIKISLKLVPKQVIRLTKILSPTFWIPNMVIYMIH